MTPELEDIIVKNIVHNNFLDKISIEKCVVDSYNLGVIDVLNWLSKMDYLTDDVTLIEKEFNNREKII